MSRYLLFIAGFFIGTFILLVIISYKKEKHTETFDNNNVSTFKTTEIVKVANLKEIKENDNVPHTVDDPTPYVATNVEITDHYNFNKLLRKREMKVMISSYDNDNIDRDNLKWITDNKYYNGDIYLTLSSDDIVKEFNNMNPFVNGYNIHNVSIQGPANVVLFERAKDISQFSILFMFMLKQFHAIKNNLFIIYGDDHKNIVINIKDNEFNNNNYYNVNNDMNVANDTNEYNDDRNDIHKSINLLNNYHYYENYDILSNKAKEQKSYKLSYFEKLYTIEIIIGDSVYNINDINMETLKRDITFLGLIMKDDVVFVHLNNTMYEFIRNSDKAIPVGKDPFVINKERSCEIVLYNFTFFNEAISDKDMKTYKLYNKYKLYGVHTRNAKESTAPTAQVENVAPLAPAINIPRALDMSPLLTTTKDIVNIAKL
jgi:hypothetical protein